MQHFGHRAGAHPDVAQGGMLGRNHLQVGHVHQRKTHVAQRHLARHGDGEAPAFGQPQPVRRHAVALQLHRCTRIPHHRAHHVEPDARIRRRGDAALHRHDIHAPGHLAQHRGGQHRKAADPGEHEYSGGPGLRVEPSHAEHEIGRIGKVQIRNARGNAGLDHAVRMLAVVLERTGGVHQQVRLFGVQQRRDVLPVGPQRAQHRRAGVVGTERGRRGEVAAADQQFEVGPVSKQSRQAPAEDAIPTQDQYFHTGNVLAFIPPVAWIRRRAPSVPFA